METASSIDTLTNTVRFDHFHTPFHDRLARFTVGFTNTSPSAIKAAFDYNRGSAGFHLIARQAYRGA